MPVLELEDGTIISECTAITEYLDQLSGETTLTGRTPQQYAVIHMMQRKAEAGLLEAVSAYFHHATPGLGSEIEDYQCAEWGNHQRDRAVAGMEFLDGVLADQSTYTGIRKRMHDIRQTLAVRPRRPHPGPDWDVRRGLFAGTPAPGARISAVVRR